jgi:hypothetical protein
MSFWIRRSIGNAMFFLAIATFASMGCGGGKGNVSGEVKYKGQPLAAGTITFLFQDGEKQVMHADITDGKYTLPPTQTGLAKVTITATPPNTSHGALPSGAPAAAASVSPDKYVPIPATYGSADQSGLTYDVKSGTQTKDFPLNP